MIGAGPIGLTLADRTRAAGLSVAAVERVLVGGVCSYWARIPSKAMLRRSSRSPTPAGSTAPGRR